MVEDPETIEPVNRQQRRAQAVKEKRALKKILAAVEKRKNPAPKQPRKK